MSINIMDSGQKFLQKPLKIIDKTKLNIGANGNVRANYLNIDLAPNQPDIMRADYSNLSAIGIADNSLEDILAIHCIQNLPIEIFGPTMKHWFDKLQKGGKLFIQAFDANILGNKLKFYQLDLNTTNQILYGRNQKSLHALGALEKLLLQVGFSTVRKGYVNDEFFIEVQK